MTEQLASRNMCEHVGDYSASLVFHFGARLPAESNALYAEALAALRSQGRKLVQITNLQGDGGTLAMRRMFRSMLAEADRRGVQDLIACVSPDAARAYCDVLGFEDLLPDEPPREWDLARDVLGKLLPTCLIRLALDDVPAERKARL